MFRKSNKNKTRKQTRKQNRKRGGKGQTITKQSSNDTTRRLTVLRTGRTPATERRVSQLKKKSVTHKKSAWDTPKKVSVMKGGYSQFKSILLKQLKRLGVTIPPDYSKNTHDLYSNYGIHANLVTSRRIDPFQRIDPLRLQNSVYDNYSDEIKKGVAWLRAVDDCQQPWNNDCAKHIPNSATVTPDAEASRRSIEAAIALNALPATNSDAEEEFWLEIADREDETDRVSEESFWLEWADREDESYSVEDRAEDTLSR